MNKSYFLGFVVLCCLLTLAESLPWRLPWAGICYSNFQCTSGYVCPRYSYDKPGSRKSCVWHRDLKNYISQVNAQKKKGEPRIWASFEGIECSNNKDCDTPNNIYCPFYFFNDQNRQCIHIVNLNAKMERLNKNRRWLYLPLWKYDLNHDETKPVEYVTKFGTCRYDGECRPPKTCHEVVNARCLTPAQIWKFNDQWDEEMGK